jgi:hypothetical protein
MTQAGNIVVRVKLGPAFHVDAAAPETYPSCGCQLFLLLMESLTLSRYRLSRLFLPVLRIRDVLSRIRIFCHPGYWIQGSKSHRIPDPDPQHWLLPRYLIDAGACRFWPEGRGIFLNKER